MIQLDQEVCYDLIMSVGGLATRLILSTLFLVCTLQGKCRNSTDFKYDLPVTSDLVEYSSVCQEFAKRTCCSAANLEAVARR